MKKVLSIVIATMLFQTGAYAGSADWMAGYQNFSINQLVIPGTHDSAAYRVEQAIEQLSPDLDSIPYVPGWIQKSIATKWGVTQSESINRQALRGYRYFDLRLCAYGEQVYACHGVYTVPITEVLNDIVAFFDKTETRKEVIILDFNHFYSITPEQHAFVLNYLKSGLGSRLAGSGMSFSNRLSDFSNAGKNVIVVYHDNAARQMYRDIAWDPSLLPSAWPNKQKVADLKAFLIKNRQYVPPGGIGVTQLVLTPDRDTITKGLLWPPAPDSLREWSDSYNPEMLNWIEANPGLNAVPPSIVIQDFVDDRLVKYALTRNARISAGDAGKNPFHGVDASNDSSALRNR
jgi:hypothetical protein